MKSDNNGVINVVSFAKIALQKAYFSGYWLRLDQPVCMQSWARDFKRQLQWRADFTD